MVRRWQLLVLASVVSQLCNQNLIVFFVVGFDVLINRIYNIGINHQHCCLLLVVGCSILVAIGSLFLLFIIIILKETIFENVFGVFIELRAMNLI